MPFNIYDVFYSQSPHQNVSAGIPSIFRGCYYYKNTNVILWLSVSPSLHNN